MFRNLLTFSALLLALAQQAHARDININPQPAGGAAVQLEDLAPKRGALFRVQRDGRTSYLFGTVHAGKESFFPLEPQATQALAESSALVLELDVSAEEPFQMALARYARYAPGDSVRNHLSADTLARLEQAMARAGFSLAGLEGYKPWLLANYLVGAEIERHGYARRNGVEQYLLTAAMQQHKPLRELESADYQLSLFDTLSDAQQEAYLRENLDDLASGAALQKTSRLIDAWSVADAPGMQAAWQALVSGGSVSAAFMEHTLLGKRNPEMAASIVHIMDQDRSAFVGVGLLHLVGERSVPALLREQGYQVDRVY